MALNNKILTGAKWLAISQAGRQLMQFLTTIVLARLLSPTDFGMIGMATVVVGFVGIFKDLGTSAAIIQREELTDVLLTSVFWLNITFGILATMVLFLCAPFAAIYYHENMITPLLRTLSLTFLISSITIVHLGIAERNLAFNMIVKVEIIATLVGSVVGIGFALTGAGVWSLIYQSLAVTSVTTVLLWQFSTWRPSGLPRLVEIHSVSKYSLNLVGFNVLNYLTRNVDYFLIGRYLGAESLGCYTLAYRLMLYPLQTISTVLGRVMFPAYSQIQQCNSRFRIIYQKVARIIAVITFPMMVGLMAVSRPFVLTVFGYKWQPVIILIIIFGPIGMMQSVGTTVGAIYQAKGRTDWLFRWGIASSIVVVTGIVIGLKWGIVGVALGYVVATALITYPSFSIPFRLIGLQVRQLGGTLLKPFLNSLIMGLFVLIIEKILQVYMTNSILLVTSIMTGVVIYLLCILTWDRPMLEELIALRSKTNSRGEK